MTMQDNLGEAQGPEARYFARLSEGIFEIQRCTACERHQFYPRMLCVHCGSEDLQWIAPSGRGTVYSYSIVRRKPEAGGDYNVVLVDLDEDVRVMSRIEGVNPDAVHVGLRVLARVALEDGKGVLVFDQTEDSHA
ncbi:Zn-ribbon domain-containing OB-fold protein [Bordetella sp. 02P26C-1]|uniref:Zn-ribbon domain-containing OB-fold protein n=1 Tax=Bordetella sp. 02P26C-1 TaxID=2683195 RepID=UPI001354617B|nr:OB-fold domain-containing protein [Bordetella sp. 02P26C-1]MVW80760.1 DNA-binding protein [Bordetella sp. 02P26C-1]